MYGRRSRARDACYQGPGSIAPRMIPPIIEAARPDVGTSCDALLPFLLRRPLPLPGALVCTLSLRFCDSRLRTLPNFPEARGLFTCKLPGENCSRRSEISPDGAGLSRISTSSCGVPELAPIAPTTSPLMTTGISPPTALMRPRPRCVCGKPARQVCARHCIHVSLFVRQQPCAPCPGQC